MSTRSTAEAPNPDTTGAGVAERIAQRTLAPRGAEYADEVRRLLDAGLEVMRQGGTDRRPRVADIVAEAGLSNDAFYRHFPSKDALVTAILEDGAERLCSYLAHQMTKSPDPRDQIGRWVDGVLAQADASIAATTLAVLWNGGSVGGGVAAGRHFAASPLADLLHPPFVALGSADPALTASLAAHATLGKLSDHLWAGTQPTSDELAAITAFCIGAAGAGFRGVAAVPIVLVGLMGAGKSTVGRRLAEATGRVLVDVDVAITARTGRTVRELWEEGGEAAYRSLESAEVLDALGRDDVVVAAPGGVILDPVVRDALRVAHVVWLRADPDVLGGRVGADDHRPLLGSDPAADLAAMAQARSALYASVADLTVDTADLGPDAAAEAILASLPTDPSSG